MVSIYINQSIMAGYFFFLQIKIPTNYPHKQLVGKKRKEEKRKKCWVFPTIINILKKTKNKLDNICIFIFF